MIWFSRQSRNFRFLAAFLQLLNDYKLVIDVHFFVLSTSFNRIKKDKEAILAMCIVMDDYAKGQTAIVILNDIENLMKNGNVSEQEACRLLGYSIEAYEDAKKLISEKLVSA